MTRCSSSSSSSSSAGPTPPGCHCDSKRRRFKASAASLQPRPAVPWLGRRARGDVPAVRRVPAVCRGPPGVQVPGLPGRAAGAGTWPARHRAEGSCARPRAQQGRPCVQQYGHVHSSAALHRCSQARPAARLHSCVHSCPLPPAAGRLQPDKGQLECADRLIAAMDLETEERGKPGPAESNNPALQVNRLDNDTRCKGRPTQRPPCMAVHSAAHSAAHSAVQLLFTLGTGTCTAVVSMKTLPERARVSLLT